MNTQEKLHQLALYMIKGVGCMLFKQLICQFGSAQEVFRSSKRKLTQIPGVGVQLANEIFKKDTLQAAEAILLQHEKEHITIISYKDDNYPQRLQQINDAPPLLYFKGNAHFNVPRVISIVGTRKATKYGKKVVEELIDELHTYNVLIVSGLAYGIDIHAHRAALKNDLPTLAVVAGGVDVIYPLMHTRTASEMINQGGLVSEYKLQTQPEAHQFPARNRIIAGMSDATIVIEAGQKSGALITANFANDYNREVFAVPGNIHTTYSKGCNYLIRNHQANILTSAADIAYMMNWHAEDTVSSAKKTLIDQFPELNPEEKAAIQALETIQKEVPIEELSCKTQIPLHQLTAMLVRLELKGAVKFLPGNKFKVAA